MLGIFRHADRHDGDWSGHGPYSGVCRPLPVTEAPKAATLGQAITAHVDRLDERHGGSHRFGSHVEWHSVRHQRRCRLVKWGKKQLPRFKKLWSFYSGKTGIGRIVQTSFLFYGGITTLFLTSLPSASMSLTAPWAAPWSATWHLSASARSRAGRSCSGPTRFWQWLCWLPLR